MKVKKTFSLGNILIILGLALITIGLLAFFYKKEDKKIISGISNKNKTGIINIEQKIIPTEIVEPTILPTPTPISFEELNKKFGPCVRVNVLIYHHIQDSEEAKRKKQESLSISPDFFRKHLQYLKDKNYTIIEPKDLIEFFRGAKQLSGKLAMITLDDAYEDNYINAYPILKEFGDKATVFTPTGLTNNLDYLTWDEINQMKDLVYFGNHTWSHHSAQGTEEILKSEITLADKQLFEKGLNNEKVFAYPYGGASIEAIKILKENNYALAFTTKHGNIMCKDQSLQLPRIRVGNSPLSSFGL